MSSALVFFCLQSFLKKQKRIFAVVEKNEERNISRSSC